jgi:hypothetical protein
MMEAKMQVRGQPSELWYGKLADRRDKFVAVPPSEAAKKSNWKSTQ